MGGSVGREQDVRVCVVGVCISRGGLGKDLFFFSHIFLIFEIMTIISCFFFSFYLGFE